ncbi:hypothetical protein [Flammeovirga pacifica]|uniref:TonB C-terminal domain-containing protein n=1 Tax=Flammeovirga pacifica TaxID=915059 RepID=A0A1S1Z3P8_FLAPC|nr:hypothetical protein [Flammeovirga pacifica]OHX67861.1 hypothetical protein NH26_16710 [Flammeovirga pacifica]
MKLLIYITLLLPFYSFSQDIYDKGIINFQNEGLPCNLDSLDGEPVFEITEEPASYEGGSGKFYKAVVKTLQYVPELKHNLNNKIYITFIIDKDGNVRNLCTNIGITAKSINDFLALTANKWTPAKEKGNNVHQKMVLSMHIRFG